MEYMGSLSHKIHIHYMIGSVYLVYVPFTDGSFYKLSYVTAVSDNQSEDTILAAIDEYAAQYGLTQ